MWSIGMYAGSTPFALTPAPGVENPVVSKDDITDVPAEFVADPFMLKREGLWHMFFEVMNRATGQGAIGLAVSPDAARWTYRQIVLTEPFHLSYPYVFDCDGQVYMLPETCTAGAVRLYRAVEFPTRWTLEATLVEGAEYCDPSIFFHHQCWWLFVGLGAPPMRADTLCLYHAPNLTGPWTAHPMNPLVKDDLRLARPAGRMLQHDNRIIRFAQDCHPAYGTRVRAFEITLLTTTAYSERETEHSPILVGGAAAWNRSGMHHLDLHQADAGQWIASVDGWFAARGDPVPVES
jgi:hypothetical protein